MKKEYSLLTSYEYKLEGKQDLESLYRICINRHKIYFQSDIYWNEECYVTESIYGRNELDYNLTLPVAFDEVRNEAKIDLTDHDNSFFEGIGNGIENNEDNKLDIILKYFISPYPPNTYIKILKPETWYVKDLMLFQRYKKEHIYLIF